ncbi:MAG: hypothetical protein IKP31_02955 [Lachnospiraceae bacterium]|nr:hypothetical protein [Lachnospiraceae bacterium]
MMKKMRRIYRCITVILLVSLLGCLFTGCSGESVAQMTDTAEELNIGEINIGCFNSGEYFYYRDILDSIARELQAKGYISGYDTEKERETTKDVWDDLCQAESDKLHFIKDVYYERYYMSDEEAEEAALTDKVDLMITIGSIAGSYLTEMADRISYDYMVVAVTDAISAGIVAGEEERLNDRSFALVDTKRITRQIEAAYEIFEFKNVGVVYEDSEAAYSYSGIGQLKEAAEKYGFKIHERHVVEAYNEDYDRYYTELKAAYEELIPEIDMLYITTATIEDEKLPWLLDDVIDAGIVTVAETSESQVENGALMHITMADAYEDGQFVASRILDYAAGTGITELGQVFEIAPRICFNRTTIERTGVQIPLQTYIVADKIYE